MSIHFKSKIFGSSFYVEFLFNFKYNQKKKVKKSILKLFGYCCFWIKKGDLEKIPYLSLTCQVFHFIFSFSSPTHKHVEYLWCHLYYSVYFAATNTQTFLIYFRSVLWSFEIFLDYPIVKSKGCLSQGLILACIAIHTSHIEFAVIAPWYVLVNSPCYPSVADNSFLNHSLIASKVLLSSLSLLMSWNFGPVHSRVVQTWY